MVGLAVGTGLIVFPDPATTLLGMAIVASILGVQALQGPPIVSGMKK